MSDDQSKLWHDKYKELEENAKQTRKCKADYERIMDEILDINEKLEEGNYRWNYNTQKWIKQDE